MCNRRCISSTHTKYKIKTQSWQHDGQWYWPTHEVETSKIGWPKRIERPNEWPAHQEWWTEWYNIMQFLPTFVQILDHHFQQIATIAIVKIFLQQFLFQNNQVSDEWLKMENGQLFDSSRRVFWLLQTPRRNQIDWGKESSESVGERYQEMSRWNRTNQLRNRESWRSQIQSTRNSCHEHFTMVISSIFRKASGLIWFFVQVWRLWPPKKHRRENVVGEVRPQPKVGNNTNSIENSQSRTICWRT